MLEGPHPTEILKPTSRKKRKKSNFAVVTNVADKAGEVLYKKASTKKKTKNLKRFRPPFVVREEVAIGWAERLVIAIQKIGKRNPVLLLKTLQKFMYLIGFTIVLLIVCLFFVFKDKGGQILNYMSDKNHQHSEASRVVVDSGQK